MAFGFPSLLHPHHPRIWDGLAAIISRLKAANLVCARGRAGSVRWGEAHTRRGLARLSAQLEAGCAAWRGLPGGCGEVEMRELAASDPRGRAQQERDAARAPRWVFAAEQPAGCCDRRELRLRGTRGFDSRPPRVPALAPALSGDVTATRKPLRAVWSPAAIPYRGI